IMAPSLEIHRGSLALDVSPAVARLRLGARRGVVLPDPERARSPSDRPPRLLPGLRVRSQLERTGRAARRDGRPRDPHVSLPILPGRVAPRREASVLEPEHVARRALPGEPDLGGVLSAQLAVRAAAQALGLVAAVPAADVPRGAVRRALHPPARGLAAGSPARGRGLRARGVPRRLAGLAARRLPA